MSLFICPICGAALDAGPGGYACPKGHSYDRAREGYVHLLPANRKHSKSPGDDKGMAEARARFLSAGHYAPLGCALCGLALAHAGNAPAVLDAGCGEGYYTALVYEALCAAGKTPRMAGVDLSKPAVRRAAKRSPGVEWAVASVYHLPAAEASVDLLIDCFSPLALDEFRRVLRPGGCFLYVVPARDHLWELKEVLYDSPYPNREEAVPYEGFSYEEIVPVDFTMELSDRRDLQALFQMTPYYWKTPKAGAERLAALDSLKIRASFRIHVFQRAK